jgi:integrase
VVRVDFENKRFTLNSTEKAGMPRQKAMPDKLANMLGRLPGKTERLFGKANYKYMELEFLIVRKRLAAKLQNEKLNEIHFHTLRHWRASKEFSEEESSSRHGIAGPQESRQCDGLYTFGRHSER